MSQDLRRRSPVPPWRLAQIWEIVAVLILSPVVALMGAQLPIARQQELNGDAPHVLGATFPVKYLVPDDQGQAQVHVRGHDPFTANLWVFISCLALWAVALVRVGIRLWRLGRRWLSRKPPKRTRSYRAGYGYTPD
jgi:hypothetical protein